MTGRTAEQLSPVQRNLPLQHSSNGKGMKVLRKASALNTGSFELKVTMNAGGCFKT